MSTTSLVVELLVIGFGAAAALLLAAIGVFPRLAMPAWGHASQLIALMPTLALVYLLGVVVDRVADWVFGWRASSRRRREVFARDEDYHEAVRTILVGSTEMYSLRRYGRSRLRICRGWTVNCALLLVTSNLALWRTQLARGPAAHVFVSVALILLLLGCFFAWSSLARSEYRQIHDGARFLRERG